MKPDLYLLFCTLLTSKIISSSPLALPSCKLCSTIFKSLCLALSDNSNKLKAKFKQNLKNEYYYTYFYFRLALKIPTDK